MKNKIIYETGVISAPTKLAIIVLLMLIALIGGSAYGQENNTTRYGLQANIFIQTPFSSGGTVGVFGDVTYQYDGEEFSKLPAHQLEGVGGLTVSLSDEMLIALGGGYKQNLTYDRGQPVAYLSLQHSVFNITGKMLFSQYEQYRNNYEISGMVYPARDIFGIGLFYNKEYNCSVVGLKIGLRFFETNGGSGSRCGTRPCP